MNNFRTILTIIISGSLLVGCTVGGDNPGWEYLPEMIHPVSYDAQSENPVYSSGYTNQLPVEGSIAQGKYTYPLTNTPAGYEQAASQIHNPFEFTDKELDGEAKVLFIKYCGICHGPGGEGDGHLVQIDKFPPPPSFMTPDLMSKPQGQRYHSVMYGKGMMGSYATQVDHRERWLVLEYINKLQNESKAKAQEDETASNSEEEESQND